VASSVFRVRDFDAGASQRQFFIGRQQRNRWWYAMALHCDGGASVSLASYNLTFLATQQRDDESRHMGADETGMHLQAATFTVMYVLIFGALLWSKVKLKRRGKVYAPAKRLTTAALLHALAAALVCTLCNCSHVTRPSCVALCALCNCSHVTRPSCVALCTLCNCSHVTRPSCVALCALCNCSPVTSPSCVALCAFCIYSHVTRPSCVALCALCNCSPVTRPSCVALCTLCNCSHLFVTQFRVAPYT
jgi:hypothetical protein